MSLGNPLGNTLGNPLGLQLGGGAGSSIGDIVTRLAPPSGNFLEADGRQLQKAMYPKLYSAIGDAYSAMDPTASFSSSSFPSSGSWISIAYGSGVFVAITTAGAVSISSDKGASWVAGGALGALGAGIWRSITYGRGLFVAVAPSSTVARTSPDGVTWTSRALPAATDAWYSVTYGGGMFVSVANGGTVASSSPDGITWTQRTLPQSSSWSGVAYSNGVFLAISTGSTRASSSPDGITWTQRTLPGSAPWTTIAGGPTGFLILSSSASAVYTADGVNFLTRSFPNTGGASSASSFSNMFFVNLVGSAGVGYYTADGTTWTSITMPTGDYAANGFGAGYIVSSPNASAVGAKAYIYSATNFNIPLLRTGDTQNVAYIKVA